MHDLNTINRLNHEAFARAIHNYRAAGKFVLARYEGSTLVSIETFTEGTHAQWALEIDPAIANQGQRAVIFVPLMPFAGAQRDQSEDRTTQYSFGQLAEFGASSPDKTLGDYIARKFI